MLSTMLLWSEWVLTPVNRRIHTIGMVKNSSLQSQIEICTDKVPKICHMEDRGQSPNSAALIPGAWDERGALGKPRAIWQALYH